MKSQTRLGLGLALAFALSACQSSTNNSSSPGGSRTPESSQGITNGVVKVMAYVPVEMDGSGNIRSAAKVENPVTIVNPTNVKFEISGNAITYPPITNAMLDFGKLTIGDVFDNNLSVCGANGKTRCTKAYIQMYTIGTPGAGVWNTDGSSGGMPIYANQTGSARLTVGLNAANAAVVQQFTIAAVKNVLRLSDFPTAAAYEMRSDFTNAGAGTYSTTLVVEYGLLP